MVSGSSSGGGGAATGVGATTDVLTYHNDTLRTGQNLAECILTPANVNSSTFGLLRTLPADDPVDATPLIACKSSIAGGVHNVVLFATEMTASTLMMPTTARYSHTSRCWPR